MTEMMMLSRVADSLYWMSRYLERAESMARFIDVHLNLMLDREPGIANQKRLLLLLESLQIEDFPDDVDGNDALRQLTFDTEDLSILTSITGARDNARQVREQISSEMWTQINTLYLYVRGADADVIWEQSPYAFYKEIKQGAHLFQGITDATMNHHQGWHFIQVGRYIERVLGLLNLLGAHFKEPTLQPRESISTHHYFELLPVLKSVSAFEAYCKVYNPNLQPTHIVEFLIFNPVFPRSMRFCVDQVLDSLHALAEATNSRRNPRLHRIAGRLQSSLNYDEVDDIRALPEYLANIKQQVHRIHDTLYTSYINYPIEAVL